MSEAARESLPDEAQPTPGAEHGGEVATGQEPAEGPLRRGYMPRSKASDWRTPADVIDLLHTMWDGQPELDPCASSDKANHFARLNIRPPRNGLTAPWRAKHAFVNPPFDQLAVWAEKCAVEASLDPSLEVVLLLPARTDTRYWHQHVRTATAICLWKGRLTFVGAQSVAPFPVAFAYWGRRPWLFARAFSQHGMVFAP